MNYDLDRETGEERYTGGLAPNVASQPAGILGLADTLSRERFNGAPLRTIEPRLQSDMVIEASAMIDRYKEQ